MKWPNLFILFVFVLIFIASNKAVAQNHLVKSNTLSVNIKPILYQLTPEDRLNFIITAGHPIKMKRDTFVSKLSPNDFHVYRQKEDHMTVPIIFTNNSNDTLKYIGMECTWWDIYLTNNSNIHIQTANYSNCYKNGPTVITILPKNFSIIDISIGGPEDLIKGTKFRIGMIFQKYIPNEPLNYFVPMARETNTIWSNEIEMP